MSPPLLGPVGESDHGFQEYKFRATHAAVVANDQEDQMSASASFSNHQLAQLRSVVLDAFREEMQARHAAHIDLRSRALGQSPSKTWSTADESFPVVRSERAAIGRATVAGHPAGELPLEGGCDASGATLSSAREGRAAQADPQCSKLQDPCDGVPARAHTVQTVGKVGNILHLDNGADASIAISATTSLKTIAQKRIRRLVNNNTKFDGLMGCIILLNSAMIGVETQKKLDGEDPAYIFWFESFCLFAFVLELGLHLVADGWRTSFSSGWFWFDFGLVFTGVLSTWVIEPIVDALNAQQVPVVSQVLTLRVLRLMRLVRAMRLVESFKELWKLCSGLLKSARTMLSVCLLILVAMYVFGVLGIDLITKAEVLNANPETAAIIEEYFSSLPTVMLTLMQFANADSIASIYFPLCKAQPLLVFYFLALWLVVTVALMNLVTAIIVENAMAKGREDAEEQLLVKRKLFKKIEPQIRKAFHELDRDESGEVTLEEIEFAIHDARLKFPPDIEEYVQPDKLLDVFQFLDADSSGAIDCNEFVDGVSVLALSSVPMETAQILQLSRLSYQLLAKTSMVTARLLGETDVDAALAGRSTGAGAAGDHIPHLCRNQQSFTMEDKKTTKKQSPSRSKSSS